LPGRRVVKAVSVSSELATIQRAVEGAALLVEVGRQGGVEDEDNGALVAAILALAAARLRDQEEEAVRRRSDSIRRVSAPLPLWLRPRWLEQRVHGFVETHGDPNQRDERHVELARLDLLQVLEVKAHGFGGSLQRPASRLAKLPNSLTQRPRLRGEPRRLAGNARGPVDARRSGSHARTVGEVPCTEYLTCDEYAVEFSEVRGPIGRLRKRLSAARVATAALRERPSMTYASPRELNALEITGAVALQADPGNACIVAPR
jgi:hypothetical protein